MPGNQGRTAYTSPPLVAGLLSILLIAACGLDSAERLERGQQSYGEGEYRAAAIDARSVLQSEPSNIEARLLLGRSATRLGDYGSAEKELGRAVELGASPADVAVDLGQVLLNQGKFQAVLDTVTAETGGRDAQATMRLRADAHLGLGNSLEARELYQALLAEDDQDREAMLGVVSSYLVEGRFDQARATLDQVRSSDPDYVPAWLKSGAMHMMTNNAAAAERDFSRAAGMAAEQSSASDEAAALRGLTEARLQQGDNDAASESLARLVELEPNDLGTRFLQARLAYSGGDLETAQNYLQELLQQAPDFRPAQILIGAVHLGRGNLGQADMYLSAVVAATPGNADARRLLAETRIQQNQADDAATLLQPLIDNENGDARALALAARARIAAGNFSAATELLEGRLQADPDNQSLKLDLAAAYLAAGDAAAAEALLAEDESTDAGTEYRRDMLGILANVRRANFDEAIGQAQSLVGKYPDDLRLRNILGGIYLTTRDYDAAFAEYQAALDIKPGDRATLMNLGRLETARRNYDGAKARFGEVLQGNPDDSSAMLALAMLASSTGDDAVMVDWLQKARDAGDNSVVARLMLARHRIGEEDYRGAADVAAEAIEIDQNSADAHALLGMAQDGMGESARALESYRRSAELQPGESRYALNYARALLRAGQAGGAGAVLDDLDKQDLSDMPSLAQLAALRAASGDFDDALRIAEDLAERFPDNDAPHVLLGEIHFKKGDAVRGARAFDQALGMRMSLRVAGRAYALRNAHGMANPEAPLQRYLEQNPDDARARLMLAQHSQVSGQNDAASESYEAVLRQHPENFTALNNLAWLRFVEGDDSAEELARRAHAQAPGNSSVLDTLGWILVSDGDLTEGVELLRKADELSDGRPAIRYHLAVGLARAGENDEARNLLETLLANTANFNERGDAEALLDTL